MRSKAPLLSADIQHTKGKWEWKREGTYASCFRGGQMAMGQATNDVSPIYVSTHIHTDGICMLSIYGICAQNNSLWHIKSGRTNILNGIVSDP